MRTTAALILSLSLTTGAFAGTDPDQSHQKNAAQQSGVSSKASQAKAGRPQDSGSKKMRLSGLEFGFEISPTKVQQYRQTGEISKDEISQESGILPGVYGTYTFHPKRLVLRPEGRFSFNRVTYVNPGYPDSPERIEDIWNNIVEARCVVGFDIRRSERVHLTPITGIGYRYRYDGMGGKKNRFGTYFYDYKSHYLYTPIGMEGMARAGRGWFLGASGEYDHFWRGWLRSEYGDANLELPTLTNIQKNGWGVRGSIRIVRKLGKRDLVLSPFIRYWNFKESEIGGFEHGGFTTTSQEPANNTTEWGASLGIRF